MLLKLLYHLLLLIAKMKSIKRSRVTVTDIQVAKILNYVVKVERQREFSYLLSPSKFSEQLTGSLFIQPSTFFCGICHPQMDFHAHMGYPSLKSARLFITPSCATHAFDSCSVVPSHCFICFILSARGWAKILIPVIERVAGCSNTLTP
jgi:hypothetical protein